MSGVSLTGRKQGCSLPSSCLAKADGTGLQGGIWKTLRLCGMHLTGHSSCSDSQDDKILRFFFLQLYANTFPLVLSPPACLIPILQPPGCEILQCPELCCAKPSCPRRCQRWSEQWLPRGVAELWKIMSNHPWQRLD